jgi:uncharacterized protein (DUF849 family)
MAEEDPVVIACALSGALAGRERCPAIPYTPQEHGAEARRAVEEGATMIHVHARTPDGAPSSAVEDFRAIARAIRAEAGDDVILNFSTGTIGVPLSTRLAYLRELRPDVAALNMGSMNYAKYSSSRKAFVFDMVFQNPFGEIVELLGELNALGIRPECECFDLGHVGALDPLADMGLLDPPAHVNCVMGVVGGIPPTARNLAAMAGNLPAGAHWGAVGVGRRQWLVLAAALTLGGSIRAGLEDNFHLPDGTMARSNGDLVAHARILTEAVGRRPATAGEARELLGLPAPARAA